MNGQFENEHRSPVRADFQLQVDEPAKRIQIID